MSQWPEDPGCEETRQNLELLLDGELPEIAMSRTRSHLDHCLECAAHLQLAKEIQTELHALPELDAPAPVLQEILDQTVRAREQPYTLTHLWGRWPRPAWAALAVAALVLALGLGMLARRSAEPVPPDTATLALATAQARYALVKTGLLTRKAGEAIRDQTLRDRIVVPASRGLSLVLGNPAAGDEGVSSEGVDDV